METAIHHAPPDELLRALQESATYLAYRAQKDRAEVEKDATLEAIFFLVSRDEAAHAGFYRAMIEIEMAEDRVGTGGPRARDRELQDARRRPDSELSREPESR